MAQLTVGQRIDPWFGPGVFDDAARCPAKASTSLRGWALPLGLRPPLKKEFVGAWPATSKLLAALAGQGPTSHWTMGTHPGDDLAALAASALPGYPSSVQDFAVSTVGTFLEAQAATGIAFDYDPSFISRQFPPGKIHGGGVFAFQGPAGRWQAWRLRLGSTHVPDAASLGWALTAAYALAGYQQLQRNAIVGEVAVYEFSAADAQVIALGAWASAEIDSEFDKLKSALLTPMAHDLTTTPGPHCIDCRFVGACPKAQVIDGLIQGVRPQRAPRKITASDLQMRLVCPHRYNLLGMHGLPGEPGEVSVAMSRGRIVDEWLTSNHRRGDRACNESDLSTLRGACEDAVATAMAAQHLNVCPFEGPGIFKASCQADIVALDRETLVLLLARPDLTFERDGHVVWRETKTRSALTTQDAETLVSTNVTAALYLTVLASGAAGPAEALEWEELGADSHELTILPCDDEELVDAARRLVSSSVADLIGDDVGSARPGRSCESCRARRWCRYRI